MEECLMGEGVCAIEEGCDCVEYAQVVRGLMEEELLCPLVCKVQPCVSVELGVHQGGHPESQILVGRSEEFGECGVTFGLESFCQVVFRQDCIS
jgi:hypothetical protein